jgi:hypothetical protein
MRASSVPPLAETVELILVNKIDFLATCHPGDKRSCAH